MQQVVVLREQDPPQLKGTIKQLIVWEPGRPILLSS